IHPTIVMGHSVGEYTAACVAGAFSFEDGLRLMAERGRLMEAQPAGGRMVAVFARPAAVEAAVASTGLRRGWVAAVNGPELVVISGADKEVEAVLKRLSLDGIKGSELAVSHAFHSPLMQPVTDAFEKVASGVQYSNLNVGFVSAVSGELADARLIGRPEY